MDKHQPQPPDEEPGLEGPDYVALVIEWDDLDDALDDALGEALGEAAELGMAAAPASGMSTSEEEQSWNRVDEASMESFPASDPPAWGSSHAVAEVILQEEEEAPERISEEVTSPFRSRARRLRGVRRLVLGIAALVALFSMIEGLRRLRHRHA